MSHQPVFSRQRILHRSRYTGAAVASVLALLALAVLAVGQRAYQGAPGTWVVLVVLAGMYPAVIWLSVFFRDEHWALRLLLAQALVTFWATFPETALLPARWLLYASLVAQACTVLPRRWRIFVVAGLVVELLLVQHGIPGMTAAPPDAVITAVVVFCLVIPGFLLHRIETLTARLEDFQDRNSQLHASVLQLTSANTVFLEQANAASEESAVLERHRITRDLHDVVGQTLTNIIMMMDATLHRQAHEPEETVKLLKWIRKQAQSGLEETRAVLYELRALKPTALRGLKALKKLVETFSRLSRIKTKVEWGNLPWVFDPEQEVAVYHLVQESLSNSFRHGSATRIDLHFQVDQGVLHILVRDNGRGGADAALGLGQRGMEERLARWSGTVSFHSEAYGYAVTASLPLKEDQAGRRQNSDRG